MQEQKTYYPEKLLELGFDKYLDGVDWNYAKPDVTHTFLYECFYNWRFNNKYKFCQPSYNQYQNFLYESLSYSYDIHLLKNKLYQKYNSVRYIEIDIDTLYVYAYDDSEKDTIEKLCDFYGYFIAKCAYENKNNYVYIIETTYGLTELTDYIYNEYNGILYHITNTKSVNKILKQGLCTKARNKQAKHPERIYFTFNNDMGNLSTLGKELYPDRNYAILKVDLNKNIGHKCKFFIDAAYHTYGVWTCDMISPNCIELYQ